ncbi:MAG TPA: DUF5666 domain-containing protein [Thermoleophilaceae bacterium]|jgi:hypothetical protein
MRKIAGITAAVVALSAGAVAGTSAVAAPAPQTAAAAAVREFEGTVVSVNRDNKTFRLRDSERGTVRIKVTRSTDFERLRGFSSLHRGLRRIEVDAKRVNGAWVAREVERSGGGGRHDDDRAGDDHGGHGDDDPAGDDRGGDR